MKKVERNDPCPCGSGKKYKQCCLKRDEALAASRRAETASIPQAIQVALEHHLAGRLPQAESIYQQILQVEPSQPDALHYLGVIAHQVGKIDIAVELIGKAIRANPSNPMCYINLGNALKDQGKLDAALESYQKALELQPDYADAHYNLGLVFQAQGKLDAAVASYQKALSLRKDYAEAHNNLGMVLHEQGKFGAAIEHYRHALLLQPGYAKVHSNLGTSLQSHGDLDAAVESFQKALSLQPDYADAHYNLGNAFQAQGKLDAAIESYQKSLMLKPDCAEAHYNLGNVFLLQDKLDAVIEQCRKALAINPDYAEAHSNLGFALQVQGRLDEAIEHYHKSLSNKPDLTDVHSNLLFTLNYHPDLSAEDIYRAYQEFDTQRCIPLRSAWRAHSNDRNPDRRLRVGYVSPDFRYHSCRCYLEPLLAHHDKTQVEVFAYAELSKEDDMAARYRSYVEHWIPTKGMSDEALAQRIRDDGIDILVDLAGHTVGKRLLVFARKPAPVSVSWLGYGYTTGLSAIDYYLTDEACVPKGSEGLFSEQPWRIATPAYVYRPTDGMGEVSSLPAQQRGYITFGTLTRSVRVNHRTIRVWSAILDAVPGSRLIMDSLNFKEPAMQERMAAKFAEHGIARERLEMGYHSPPWDTLRGLDIGLDCFPHNSGATLFETLYMGVPYITLAGRPSVGRLGSSVLQGAGHPEWIAGSEDEYVSKAVELAGDVARLSEMRSELREQMEASPLRDEAGFTRKVEDAYRRMWKNWCEKG
jgi:predicted O-linked N-acetylglucosamine transferase (SPINDLY family)